MNARVVLEGSREEIGRLNGAGDRMRRGAGQLAFRTGATAVERVKRDLLSGPTSATQTEVRSGQRRRSYDHRVGNVPNGVALDIGAINPGAGGKIPIQSRVFEGFDAAGNRVSKFVIKSKTPGGRLGPFPIRRGPGLAKGNIVGWARPLSVTLYPRPTLPLVEKIVTPILESEFPKVFRDAVRA